MSKAKQTTVLTSQFDHWHFIWYTYEVPMDEDPPEVPEHMALVNLRSLIFFFCHFTLQYLLQWNPFL